MEADDAAVFFGRDAQIVLGLDALRGMRESGVERLFMILGASGSGKSSFMRAGLLPRLERDDRNFFPLPVIRPEDAVINGGHGLIKAIQDAFKSLNHGINLAEIESRLANGSEGLSQLLTDIQHHAHQRVDVADQDLRPPTLIIAVDQTEELFNPGGSREANHFLGLLGQCLGRCKANRKTNPQPVPGYALS